MDTNQREGMLESWVKFFILFATPFAAFYLFIQVMAWLGH
jgi:hypothetical protein